MKIDLKNLFKKRVSFRKGGFHANPNMGWELILGLASVLILGFFALGFYIFIETNREFNAPFADRGTGTNNAQAVRLQSVLQIFTDRAQKSGEILGSPAAIVDPSL